jgi:hypothetical protein
MLGIQRLGRALRVGSRQDLVVIDIATLAHLTRCALAPDDDDPLERRQVAHHLVDAVLDRGCLALSRGPVDGYQRLRLRELHPLAHGLRREASEDDVVRGADARAREHRDGDLGDHRQVDPDDVALTDAEVLESVGEALDLGQQLGIGDVALLPLLPTPVKRDAVADTRLDMAVQAVEGRVEGAPHKPLVERRVAVVKHGVPGAKPVQLLSLVRPPSLWILRRLLVDRRIVQQRLLAELARRSEPLHVQELGQLAVELLADGHLRVACHHSATRAALAPALAR